ncbi:MAG: NAD-dependent epimerase/dehydratase family protein [Myxococcota bacterium]
MNSDLEAVCVTGASGFVGYHLCARLVARGYQVHAAVRDPKDEVKVSPLKTLGVKLFGADLNEEHSFDEALQGCQGLFHVASSVRLHAKDPQRQIVDPAVQGTLNVLRSARKAGSIRRVVQTSSIAAIVDNELPLNTTFDESVWNHSASLGREPYPLSKVLAERAALWFTESLPKTERWVLTSLHPSFVLGPLHSKTHLRSSPVLVRQLLRGSLPAIPDLIFGFVDVRDVAEAHLRAYEHPSPSSRYLCSNVSVSLPELASLLSELFPQSRVSTRTLPHILTYLTPLVDKRFSFHFLRKNLGKRRTLSNQRIKEELDISFRDFKESLRDCGRSMYAAGWIT